MNQRTKRSKATETTNGVRAIQTKEFKQRRMIWFECKLKVTLTQRSDLEQKTRMKAWETGMTRVRTCMVATSWAVLRQWSGATEASVVLSCCVVIDVWAVCIYMSVCVNWASLCFDPGDWDFCLETGITEENQTRHHATDEERNKTKP